MHHVHWANLLTVMRIALAPLLPFLMPLGTEFLIVYALCCITDMLDGPIARKTGTQSEQGAKLDSIADFVLAVMLVIAMYPVVRLPAGMVMWICGIAFIRAAAAFVALARFRVFATLHTFGNKGTGFLFLVFPFCLAFISEMILVWVLCIAASISALEELLIQMTAKSLQLNRKTIFIEE